MVFKGRISPVQVRLPQESEQPVFIERISPVHCAQQIYVQQGAAKKGGAWPQQNALQQELLTVIDTHFDQTVFKEGLLELMKEEGASTGAYTLIRWVHGLARLAMIEKFLKGKGFQPYDIDRVEQFPTQSGKTPKPDLQELYQQIWHSFQNEEALPVHWGAMLCVADRDLSHYRGLAPLHKKIRGKVEDSFSSAKWDLQEILWKVLSEGNHPEWLQFHGLRLLLGVSRAEMAKQVGVPTLDWFLRDLENNNKQPRAAYPEEIRETNRFFGFSVFFRPPSSS